MPITTGSGHELDAAHSDELADIAAEGSSKVVLEADAVGGIELQSEIVQVTPIPSAQETEVGIVSSSKDADVAHKVETEVEAGTQGAEAATTTNDLAAAVLPEKEQPVVPATKVFILYSGGNAFADPVLPRKDDSIKHVDEAAIVALGLAAAEGFSSLDQVVPDRIQEGTLEAANDSVESETTLNVEAQRGHDVDVTTAPETEDTLLDKLRNDATPVPQLLEPESSLIESELVDEREVESTSLRKSLPIDEEDQLDPSLVETVPHAEKDADEVQTQVDDISNIKDEFISESDVAQHIEATDSKPEGPFENIPASSAKESSGIDQLESQHIEAADTEGSLEDASTKESQITVQLEPDVDSVLPAEEEPLTIAQVAAEDLLPKIESEDTTSQTPLETIPIPEDTTTPVADVEEQIIAPVDVRSEHAAVVAHGVETEVEAESHKTDAAIGTNDLAAAESPETEQPVVLTTEVFIFYSCRNALANPVYLQRMTLPNMWLRLQS